MTIHNDAQLAHAAKRLAEEEDRITSQKRELVAMGLTAELVKMALDPMQSFHLHLVEEVESYAAQKSRPEKRNP